MTPDAIRMRARRKRPGVLEAERERSRAKHRDRREYLREWRQRPEVRERYREAYWDDRRALLLAIYEETQPNGGLPACAYCGMLHHDIFTFTVDRVIPGKQGGKYERGNMVLACSTCNSAKGDRTPEEWPHPRYYEPGYSNRELPF